MTPADPSDERFREPAMRPPIERAPNTSGSRTSAPAIVAFISSILGLCILPCIPLGFIGLVLGIVGLNEIRRSNGEVSGGGLAWTGIVLGALESVVVVVGLVLMLTGAANGVREATLGLKGFSGRGVAAATLLEQVAIGQRNMQATAYIDEDGDGIGEFGSFADLDSTADLGTQDLNDPTVQKMMGYRLRLELPETTDEREVAWWAFQEPLDADGSLPWLYIDESSTLRVSSTVSGAPSRADAQQWEVTTSQRLAESMAQDMFGGN